MLHAGVPSPRGDRGALPAWPPLTWCCPRGPGWAAGHSISTSRLWSVATVAVGRAAQTTHCLAGRSQGRHEQQLRAGGEAELESLGRAVSLVRQEAVTFLGLVPACVFLSQIRAEAYQEIQPEPTRLLLLLGVLALRALQALLPLSRSWGLPLSCPGPHVGHPGASASAPAALLQSSSSPQPCRGPRRARARL